MAKTRSTPPSAVQKRLAAERAAAARERIQVAQRRRRLTVIGTAVGAIVAVVAVFVIVKVATGSDTKSGKKTTAAQTSVTRALASVPASVFDTIGVGTATGGPQSPKSPGGLGGGKTPTVLYVGAEFCPYCAAERWPLAVALSRFGTFTNLGETSSSPSDVNPNTPTLSFHGASYTSRYLTFVGKEIQSNQVNSAGTAYTALDTLTPAQQAVFSKNGSGYPFLDIDGKYTLNEAQYDGKILAGMTQKQVAAAIDTSSGDIPKAIDGSANLITARLCQATDDKPAAVCSSSGVQAAATALAK